ncbi:MAG: serine/threonine protein kinase [Vulcanimicrobiota bacterium]
MHEHPLNAGDILRDRYEIQSIIGRGAYGMVYCAGDLQVPGATWAIKAIEELNLSDEERTEAQELFRREASILKELNHTGIPKIVDFFSQGTCHYMVMELIEGVTLQQFLKEHSPDEKTVIEWALRICDILEYLHSLKPLPLVFRDLKPSNIMITKKGRLLFIDFGIARFFKREKSQDTYLMGTPGFSPPEQYGSGQTDTRSDIYSLGASLFHILSGEDLEQFKFSIPPLSRFRSSISNNLECIIARCLEHDPEKRYQSVSNLREDLKRTAVEAPLSAGASMPAPVTVTPAAVPPPITVTPAAAVYPGEMKRLLIPAIASTAVFLILLYFFPVRESITLKQLTGCRENLKKIGTVLELYAADASGHYPSSLDIVTHLYCKSLPHCPSTRSMKYRYKAASNPDVYTIWCGGTFHVPAGVPADYPQYSSTGAEYHDNCR